MGGELGQQPLVVPRGFGRVDGQRVALVREGTPVAAEDLLHNAVADRPVGAGGLVSVAVELVGDLAGVPASLGQRQDALLEPGGVAEVLEVLDGTAHQAGGGVASGPVQDDVDQLTHAADADGDLVNDGADDLLAVGVGDAGCLPEAGQVGGSLPDRLLVAGRQLLGSLPLEAAPLLVQVPLGGQGLLPVLLQLAHHQPVLRFGEAVAAPGAVHVLLGTLEALLPDLLHRGPVGQGLLDGLEVDLNGCRGQHLEDLAGDVGVQAAAGQVLAVRAAPLRAGPGAVVADPGPSRVDVVAHGHPATAPAAAQQPGQQRRPEPDRPGHVAVRPVRLEPDQVGLVLGQRDVGGQGVLDPGQVLLTACGPPPRSPTPVCCTHPRAVGQPAAVDVDPGIDRAVDHAGDRRPGRAFPDDLALVGATASADAELDAVLHQEPHHTLDRAELRELRKDQPDHALHLLVGVNDCLPPGVPPVADRQRTGQLAPPALLDAPAPPALPAQLH